MSHNPIDIARRGSSDGDEEPPRAIPPEKIILIDRGEEYRPPSESGELAEQGGGWRRPLIFFALTCLSTFLVGFYDQPVVPSWYFVDFFHGLNSHELSVRLVRATIFSSSMMAILLAHEIGHYFASRLHRLAATLPLFIPMPFSPLGTMGAVVLQPPGRTGRRSLLDVAVAGPLAGLAVALPLAFWGFRLSPFIDASLEPSGLIFTSPLALKFIQWLSIGMTPDGMELRIHPLLLAAWGGIFTTALNLIPISQLDGGHILYALIGRTAHKVASRIFLFGVALVFFSYFFSDGTLASWSVMLVMFWWMGIWHPPTANDREPMGLFRKILGWFTLSFVVLGMTPIPIAQFHPKPPAKKTAVSRPHAGQMAHDDRKA